MFFVTCYKNATPAHNSGLRLQIQEIFARLDPTCSYEAVDGQWSILSIYFHEMFVLHVSH